MQQRAKLSVSINIFLYLFKKSHLTRTGVYYISDFSFVIRAADPDAVLTSLCTLTMGEALKLSSESQENPDQISGIVQVMVVCSMEDAVGSVLQNMMQNRSTLAVAVGANGCFLGVVTIKDLIQHFLSLS